MYLRQSTAATVKLGPFVDSADGFSPKTDLTIVQADIRLSKNGGAFAQSNNTAGATHDEHGWYGVPLDTTDTGTPGLLTVAVSKTGALPVWRTYAVLPAAVYDALVAGTGDGVRADVRAFGGTAGTFASGRPEVNVTHAAGTAWNSGAIGASTLAADTITAAKIADEAIDRATFAADTGLRTVRSGTGQAGSTSNTFVLDTEASSDDDAYVGLWLYITGGTGAGQVRYIYDYVGLSRGAVVEPVFAVIPDATSTFALLPSAGANIIAMLGDAAAVGFLRTLAADYTNEGVLTASLTGSVGSVAAGGITAASFATGAVDAAALAADAAAEVGTAVWAATTRTLTSGTNIALTKGTGLIGLNDLSAADVRSAVGLASANLDTQLEAINNFVDTEVAAIKAVTDKLDTTLVIVGGGPNYQYTSEALANAPSGGGGGTTDWTSTERQQIRYRLGIDGTESAPVTNTDLNLGTIQANITLWRGAEPAPLASGRVESLVGAYATGQAPLQPTVAGRTLDVSAGGEAGVDWANVGGQGSAVNLPATIVGGVVSVSSLENGSIRADTLEPGTLTAEKFAANSLTAAALAADAAAEVGTAVWAATTRTLTSLAGLTANANVVSMAANTLTASALAADAVDEILDEPVEGAVTFRQMLRLFAAALGGKLSGAATTSISIRDLADTKNRVVATVTADGDRTAVTLDLT